MSDEIKPTLAPMTRDTFVQFKPRTRTVDLPDFGIQATIRELRTSETMEFTKRQANGDTAAGYYLLKTAVVDADGSSLLASATDAYLDSIPVTASNAIVDAIVSLSFPQPAKAKQPTPAAG